jgi:DNA-binding MarR family transcriptional regulator
MSRARTWRRLVVLEAIAGHPGATRESIACALNLTYHTASTRVLNLVCDGLVEEYGKPPVALRLTKAGHEKAALLKAVAA